MSEDVNSQIQALQEQLNSGAISAEEYMVYVNRLLHPEDSSSYVVPHYSNATNDRERFLVYDDDDDDDDVDVVDPFDDAPPVPDELTHVYGQPQPVTQVSNNGKGVIILGVCCIIILIVALSVLSLWKMMRNLYNEVWESSTSQPTATVTEEPRTDTEAAIDDAIWLTDIYPRSRERLIEELIDWGYSEDTATYAADNSGIDWNEQARGAAENSLQYMAYSREGLIEQLESMGFSHDEAVSGVDATNTDWREQAPRMAEEYLDSGDFTRDELIDQLEYEGFSHEDAVYGVDEVGL